MRSALSTQRIRSHGITYQIYHRYHVVWATKSRCKVLCDPMRERIREIIRQCCAEMGVHIVKGALAVMQVSGGSQSFNALNQLRILDRYSERKESVAKLPERVNQKAIWPVLLSSGL